MKRFIEGWMMIKQRIADDGQQLLTSADVCAATGLSRKALRYYRDKQILRPRYIDSSSRYGYYTESQVDCLKMIKLLVASGLELTLFDWGDGYGDIDRRNILQTATYQLTEQINRQTTLLQTIRNSD